MECCYTLGGGWSLYILLQDRGLVKLRSLWSFLEVYVWNQPFNELGAECSWPAGDLWTVLWHCTLHKIAWIPRLLVIMCLCVNTMKCNMTRLLDLTKLVSSLLLQLLDGVDVRELNVQWLRFQTGACSLQLQHPWEHRLWWQQPQGALRGDQRSRRCSQHPFFLRRPPQGKKTDEILSHKAAEYWFDIVSHKVKCEKQTWQFYVFFSKSDSHTY